MVSLLIVPEIFTQLRHFLVFALPQLFPCSVESIFKDLSHFLKQFDSKLSIKIVFTRSQNLRQGYNDFLVYLNIVFTLIFIRFLKNTSFINFTYQQNALYFAFLCRVVLAVANKLLQASHFSQISLIRHERLCHFSTILNCSKIYQRTHCRLCRRLIRCLQI